MPHSTTTTTTTTAAFTIVPLTTALLPLLEEVEAASYPESYCEGVPGYAKRLHATPPCPSFVCLQRTCAGADTHVSVAELAAAGDVTQLRAIGYAVTCRMPRRSASLLLRDDGANSPTGKKNHRSSGGGGWGSAEEDGEGSEDANSDEEVPDNATVARSVSGGCDDRLFNISPQQQQHLHAKMDTFYIHDVAVHPDFRGLGVAGALWEKIEATRVALRLKRMSLVAVFGASSYWARHGFREVARKDLPAETVSVLDDYGEHAVFMERED